MLRAHQLRCAALIGGYARTAEAQALVRSRWAHDLVARPAGGADARAARRRARRQRIRAGARPGRAHCPAAVDGAAGRADGAGRRASRCWFRCRGADTCRRWRAGGAAPSPGAGTAPGRCRCPTGTRRARCAAGAAARKPPALRPTAGPMRVRAVVVGARRTAEELGRAFPGATVVTSGGTRWCSTVPGDPPLVVATPGAEPVADGRLRRGAAARRLGAARSPGPARGRGRAAPVDGRRGAGPAARRRRRGGGGRRVGDPDRAGADPVGSGRARRGRARRARRRSACRPPCTSPPSTARRQRWPHSSTPPDSPTLPSFSGPSTCRPVPADLLVPRPQTRSAACWSGCPGQAGLTWPLRYGVRPGCSARGTISSRFGCKSTRCT